MVSIQLLFRLRLKEICTRASVKKFQYNSCFGYGGECRCYNDGLYQVSIQLLFRLREISIESVSLSNIGFNTTLVSVTDLSFLPFAFPFLVSIQLLFRLRLFVSAYLIASITFQYNSCFGYGYIPGILFCFIFVSIQLLFRLRKSSMP